ncbi:DnaJ domain-containing protein [Colletotrichum eremochloae]|uniref:Putative DnaJ domain-containing protein n=1 Tax=Colletotrichum sublineola TaxID=1173701 RepID=A0A066X1P1_COLSU|nr:DnaJ domain-containing protein [Colletotrichum sublineola]KAK2011257.1 DnaJ domain-containing protein [Colletotrichum eremochloae]KDN62877.1 putative DnaJ domain-containing protein [Colletotrichum sublineola]
MGAQQSSGRDHSEGFSQPAKTCYYELLGVERDATDDEIKKSYRRRALELHPDRNLNDIQNATRRFAEVQAAYEVLSDPQERAWYDSHREAILRGADPDDSDARSPEYNNVKLTSTDDIFTLIRRFNSTVPFTDDPSGFFGIAKATFDHLADEEIAAGEYAPGDIPDYPSFGFSTDSYEAVAKPFYGAWASFSTRKTYAWKDKYRLSDAPDRRIRRLMEKENKKTREEAIREFNDAVRFLVTFVRKRDPRYLPNTQTASERQESLRTAAAAQAARSRAANKEKLSEAFVPGWAQARDEADAGNPFFESEEDDSEVEEIECVVCKKTFKSEKSFEAHERSKKHVKAVQQLRRQMRDEDLDLSLNETPAMPEKVTLMEDTRGVSNEQQKLDAVKEMARTPDELTLQPQATEMTDDSSDILQDDEYASRADVEKRLFASDVPHAEIGQGSASRADSEKRLASLEDLSLGDDEEAADGRERTRPKKVGKAKAKREKRAARQAAEEDQAPKHTCGVCKESFVSKTKLFTHIRDLDHAAPIVKPAEGGKKKKR